MRPIPAATNPHWDSPLALYGAPVKEADVVAVLLHGRAQTPEYMLENVVRRIDLPGIAYLAPAAAERTWYRASFMAAAHENEPELTYALERLARLCHELEGDGIAVAELVVIGFSQGACLACEFVRRRRQRFGALVALTGGLIGPPGTDWSGDTDDAGAYRAMPVLLGGSDADPWVPAERMLATAEWFRRFEARVNVKLYAGMGHAIADEQIDDARAILLELATARRSGHMI